jgi:hypothetical protein
MKIETPEDLRALADAADDLASMPYWIEASRASVMRYLAEMCPHREALHWLVRTVVNHVGTWPGVAELRGILCTRYDPADRIDGDSTIPGFRPEDAEMRYRLREAESYAALPSSSEALARLTSPAWIKQPATEAVPRIPALRQLPTGCLELKPTSPNAYELNLIRDEANDCRLSAEARERAKRILERMEQTG